MKQMTKEAQMQKNGGYYWHCHKCYKDYWALSKSSAAKNASKHIKNMGHTGTGFWDYGQLKYCPNTYK